MANIAANGNGPWYVVKGSGFQPSAVGTFGSGTITFEIQVGDTQKELADHDNSDTVFSYTDDFDDYFNLLSGTYVRLVLTGATSPDIDYEMNGCYEA